jgi:hypothetical protein
VYPKGAYIARIQGTAAHSATTDAVTIPGQKIVVTASANDFTPDDIGQPVTASAGFAGSNVITDVKVGGATAPGRAPADGVTVTTPNAATVSSTDAAFVSNDIGRTISGTNIPAGTYIIDILAKRSESTLLKSTLGSSGGAAADNILRTQDTLSNQILGTQVTGYAGLAGTTKIAALGAVSTHANVNVTTAAGSATITFTAGGFDAPDLGRKLNSTKIPTANNLYLKTLTPASCLTTATNCTGGTLSAGTGVLVGAAISTTAGPLNTATVDLTPTTGSTTVITTAKLGNRTIPQALMSANATGAGSGITITLGDLGARATLTTASTSFNSGVTLGWTARAATEALLSVAPTATLTGANTALARTMSFGDLSVATMDTAADLTGEDTQFSADAITVGGDELPRAARVITDLSTTTASTTITSASAHFDSTDVGLGIDAALLDYDGVAPTEDPIPAGAYIASVTNDTTAVLSANATKTFGPTLPASCFGSANGFIPGSTTKVTPTSLCTPVTATIGAVSTTAPLTGDVMSQLATSLQLDPSLVSGSDFCSAGTPEGFTISGTWSNLPTTAIPASASGAMAKIDYPTAVVSFFAFIVPRYVSGDAVNGAEHVDIVYPSVPTDIALCTGGEVVTILKYNATAVSQQKLVTGTGQPSSSQIRGLDDSTGVKTVTFASDDPYAGGSFSDTCTIPSNYTYTGVGDAFPCGD